MDHKVLEQKQCEIKRLDRCCDVARETELGTIKKMVDFWSLLRKTDPNRIGRMSFGVSASFLGYAVMKRPDWRDRFSTGRTSWDQ